MNAVDLFCGVGGMSLGFERAGFNVLASFDFEPKHIEAYKYNFHNTEAQVADIRKLTAAHIRSVCKTNKQIDVVFGGPPCQGFSVGGRGNIEDERNSLLHEFARVVSELKPKAFVVENVTGLTATKYEPLVASFLDEMKAAGYHTHCKPWILNAADFGIPQRRKRVFFVGVLENAALPRIPEPALIWGGRNVQLSVEDALADLPEVEKIDYLLKSDRYLGELGMPSEYARRLREPHDEMPELKRIRPELPGLGGCARTNHGEETRKRFRATAPGASEPISRFYRLSWNGLAPTLRAGTPRSHGQHMAARPIHPDQPRCITVREAARLHSFPDWFEFYPTKWYGFMQIGNSVPPYLAEAVAKAAISTLS